MTESLRNGVKLDTKIERLETGRYFVERQDDRNFLVIHYNNKWIVEAQDSLDLHTAPTLNDALNDIQTAAGPAAMEIIPTAWDY